MQVKYLPLVTFQACEVNQAASVETAERYLRLPETVHRELRKPPPLRAINLDL
jgi:hypothetical protein